MTPSLRDAQVAKLVAENERLRVALDDCIEELSIQAGEGTSTKMVSDHPIWLILERARAALAEEQEE